MQKKRGDFSVLTEKKRVKRVPDTVTETERERGRRLQINERNERIDLSPSVLLPILGT